MSSIKNEANRRLATVLGWTNIVEAGGALLGSPPWAIPHARGQMAVPNWAGDWREAGPLMLEYGCYLDEWPIGSMATFGDESCPLFSVPFTDAPSKSAAAMLAIVRSVAAKLEART